MWVLGLQPGGERMVSPRPVVSFSSAYWEACAGGWGVARPGWERALCLNFARVMAGGLCRPAALFPDTVHAQDAGPLSPFRSRGLLL